MKFIETALKGLVIIKLEPFKDDRGQFSRIYCEKELKEIGHLKRIVQINQSLTKRKGTLRGLHYQVPPRAEIKIVRCVRGSVFDVAVDLRCKSKTFLKWQGEILSEINDKMFYIPEGFAHGFQALEENSQLLYFHTDFYSHEYEKGILFNDPKIDIKWPMKITEVSERDKSFNYISDNFDGVEL